METFRKGEKIGKFVVDSFIKKGAVAESYTAYGTDDMMYFLKIFDLALIPKAQFFEGKEVYEIVLCQEIDNDNIIKFVDKGEVKKGNRAYIVFPLIDESEALSAKAATKEKEKLEQKIFPDLRIGLVHGKMSAQEKEDNMKKFKDGEYDILVSTTVIEVGVDVPEATVMIIENAERFGLSQLHQLRGRVGRSDRQSYCILASDTKSPETKARLSVMTQTNNGFVIAEKDLQLRGPGEFMGTRQSGLPDLMIADLVHDVEILEAARSEAIEFVKDDNINNYPLLQSIIEEKLAEMRSFVSAG